MELPPETQPMDHDASRASLFPPLPELVAQCAQGDVTRSCDSLRRHLAENPRDPVATLLLKFLAAAAGDYAAVLRVAAEEGHGDVFGPDQFERLGNRLSTFQGMADAAAIAYEIAGEMDHLATPALDPFDGPFNGQENRRSLFDAIVSKLEIEAIVETGTYRASTTAYMAKATGLPVFSCEVVPRLFAYSRRRLEALRNAVIASQDSRAFLKALVSNTRFRGRRVLFYLDAHWYENLPLKEEMQIILGADLDPVIMADDFAVPGDPQYGFDDYGPGKALRITYLTPFADDALSYFFPRLSGDRETGKQRGCVVLCRPPTGELLHARIDGFFRLSWRDAILAELGEQLTDRLSKLAKDDEDVRQRIGQKDQEIAVLNGLRQQQIHLLNKLVNSNETLQAQLREVLASRWRKLGRRLHLARAASFEK
jgi:hypothetical protein